jgi:hypothetical protein
VDLTLDITIFGLKMMVKSSLEIPANLAGQFSLSGQIFFCKMHMTKKYCIFFHLCFLFYRFYGFRRLNYNTKNGKLGVSGFCDPHSKEDVTADDAEMWEATADNAPDGLSVDQAKYVTPLLLFLSLYYPRTF